MYWSIDLHADSSLQSQIAGAVRRAIAGGELTATERLPPAAELAEALKVDRNTVLAAYRSLRDEGALEFRRGRGVRVAEGAVAGADVGGAARALVALAESHGYQRKDLIRLMEELT